MEDTADDFEIEQGEHPDDDIQYTYNDLVDGFQERGFHGNMYASFGEFCQEELRDEEYIQGLIDRNQRDTELRPLYRAFLSHEEENQQERFEALVDKIAHAAAKRANLSIGEDEYGKNISCLISPAADDVLDDRDIQKVLDSNDPEVSLKDIVEEAFEQNDGTIEDAIWDAYDQDISNSDRQFFDSYRSSQGFDSSWSVSDIIFDTYYPSYDYDIDHSPILNQSVPVDIIYEPDHSETSHDTYLLDQFAVLEKDAPLYQLAKQQGVHQEFFDAIMSGKNQEHPKISDPLVKDLYDEAASANPQTNLVFCSSMPFKECLELAKAQRREEAILGEGKGKGTIQLPQDIRCGVYDFHGTCSGMLGVESLKKPVKLPLKDIRLIDDNFMKYQENRYPIQYTFAMSTSAWKDGAELHAMSDKEIQKARKAVRKKDAAVR